MSHNMHETIPQARHLLHAIAVCDPSEAAALDSVAHALRSPLDWPYALERGTRHKLLPWMNYILKFVPPDVLDAVPPDARRTLMVAALNAEANYRRQTAVIKTILGSFARRGLPVMVIKGLTMSALYPQPALRSSGDIDLIVHERDWPAVAAALHDLRIEPFPECSIAPQLAAESALYRVSYFPKGQISYRAPCGTVIEVHFRLLNMGIPAAIEDAWGQLRIQQLDHLGLPTVNQIDTLLFHILHMQGHHFVQMNWFTDLGFMLKAWGGQLDWPQVKKRARQWRIERTVAYVFEVFQEMGGVLPEGMTASGFEPSGRIRRSRFHRRWPKERLLRMEHEPPSGASVWLYLHQRASWSDRLRFLWRALLPPRACLGSESRCQYWARLLHHAV